MGGGLRHTMNFAPAQYANILFMLGGIKQTTAPTAARGWTVIAMAKYTNIETAMAIICDMCECLYPGLFCPEKPNLGNNLGKCDRRKHLEEDAANVAPVVHGRWEPYFEEVEIYNAGGFAERKQTGWICGRCKSIESITRYYKTNYCPNCGARMDEVNE